jgi:hypothetical protein
VSRKSFNFTIETQRAILAPQRCIFLKI